MDPGQEEGPSAEELLGLLNGGSADNEERPPPPRASCSSASNEDVDGGTGSAANAAAVPAIATQPQHHPWVPGSPSGPLLLDQRGELSSSPSDDGRNGDSNGGDRSVDDEAQVEDQLPEDSLAVAAHQDADHPAASARKRYCRFPGCDRVVKSQGHCQKHGARAKRCRVPGCDKQAQGTHDGMCKRHWKEVHFPDPALLEASAGLLGLPPSDPRAAQLLQVAQRTANPEAAAAIGPGPELAVNMATAVGVHPYPAAHSESVPVGYGLSNRQLATPIGESVYDSIIPQSVGYRPGLLPVPKAPPNKPGAAPATGTADTDSVKPGPGAAPADVSGIGSLIYAAATPAATAAGSSNSSPAVPTMPLVAFLRRGQSREVGWHRQQERLARGLLPIASLATQLESWERQLVRPESHRTMIRPEDALHNHSSPFPPLYVPSWLAGSRPGAGRDPSTQWSYPQRGVSRCVPVCRRSECSVRPRPVPHVRPSSPAHSQNTNTHRPSARLGAGEELPPRIGQHGVLPSRRGRTQEA